MPQWASDLTGVAAASPPTQSIAAILVTDTVMMLVCICSTQAAVKTADSTVM